MAKKLVTLGIAILLLFSMAALTACGNEEDETMGTFYSLQEAYDEGLLAVEDLQNIASYSNCDPEELSEEVAATIREARAKALRTRDTNPKPEATADDITIIGYFGTYNDCVAIRLNDSFTDYPDVVREIVVAGITFVYSGASIIIWK